MKVAEIIQVLSKYDSDMRVVVSDGESYADPVINHRYMDTGEWEVGDNVEILRSDLDDCECDDPESVVVIFIE